MKILRRIAIGFVILATVVTGTVWWAARSLAGVSCSVPFNLQNGTTADASQVMANYNAIISCLNSAAAAGVNSDITSLLGLTTALPPSEGGTSVFFSANPSSGSVNTLVVTNVVPNAFATKQGYQIVFQPSTANTGAVTLSVATTGAVALNKQSSTGPIALTGGEIVTGQTVWATFDGFAYEINPIPNIVSGFGLSGTNPISISSTHPPYGFDSCVNLAISATVGSSKLGVQLLAADTNLAPTVAHPILCPFRDPTVTGGDIIWRAYTTPIYIDTNAAGASLGTVNNTPFKIWIVVFDNAGVPVPALFQSVSTSGTQPTNIAPLQEAVPTSTTGISAAATNAGIFYTPNGTSLSGKSWRIVGYMEWNAGLATAGTYATGPTSIQPFGPGINKPGQEVQRAYNQTTTSVTTASTTLTSTGALQQAITPSLASNLIEVSGSSPMTSGTANCAGAIGIMRGATAIGVQSGSGATATATSFVLALDAPGTVGSTTYSLGIRSLSGCTVQFNAVWPSSGASLLVKEFMD